MESEGKQFTLKPAVAAMSGAIIAILGIMLSLDTVNDTLKCAVIIASVSLPALTALPMLDAYRDNNKIINAAFGFASFFGFGGFAAFITALIFNFSSLGGYLFIIFGVLWVFILLKFKKEPENSESS